MNVRIGVTLQYVAVDVSPWRYVRISPTETRGYRPRRELFKFFSVDSPHPGWHTLMSEVTVEGTEDEREQWTAAEREYRAALDDAGKRLGKVLSRRWLLRLPGVYRQVRQQYQERTDAATNAYRPVYEEINRRVAERQRAWQEEERKRQASRTPDLSRTRGRRGAFPGTSHSSHGADDHHGGGAYGSSGGYSFGGFFLTA